MNDVYTIDRTRTLPPTLASDQSSLYAAKVIGEQMEQVASIIYLNKIYPRIEELDETTLDILAHDLHVDWYDYTYDVPTKRAVIKNSVRIHMKLGTKYAVETATSDVYPGSTVEEWFEYGGDPYFFRLNVDITSGGITVAQQLSLYQKIQFYKNCRSHLDYFNFQMNLEMEVRLGGYTSYIKSLVIQPFLETEINLESTVDVGGFAQADTALEIQPFLETEINLETTVELGGIAKTETALTIQPMIETEIDLDLNVDIQGATKAEQSLVIQPFLEKSVELETTVDMQGTTKTETALEIQPFLTKEINVSGNGKIILGAETVINQKIEIKEKENEK